MCALRRTFSRRTFLHLTSGAIALPAVSRAAWAQTYPTRPVRIVVGSPPGGGADIYARLIASWLSERLGQQFIVENRPGAGGNLAAEAVVRAPPDGYTLLLGSSADVRNMSLYDNLRFNFIKDLAPVARFNSFFNVIVVHPSFPAKTIPEFIAMAKASPGKITMGSGGIGNGSHVYGEQFKATAGVNMLHVAYRGEGPALTDLIAGQIQVVFPVLVAAIEHIKSGGSAPLPLRTPRARWSCRTFRPSENSCRASRAIRGTQSSHRKTHRPRSSTNAIAKSIWALPIPGLGSVLPISVTFPCRWQSPISARSSSHTMRSGAKSSATLASRRSNETRATEGDRS